MKTSIKNTLNSMHSKWQLFCNKWDVFWNKAFDFFFKKHTLLTFIILISLSAIGIRYAVALYPARDLGVFIFPWINTIREGGGFEALANPPGNYLPSYMNLLALVSYLPSGEFITDYYHYYFGSTGYYINDMYYVKTLSFIFDAIAATGILMIARYFNRDDVGTQLFAFGLFLILPTVFTNSAIWGQADMSYTCFIIWSIYFLLKERPKTAAIFFGLALSFKIQAIFFIPVLGYLWLFKKFRLTHFFISIGTVFITFLPWYFAGASFTLPFEKFINFFGEYSALNLNSGSIFAFFANIRTAGGDASALTGLFSVMSIFLTFASCLIVLAVLYCKKIAPTPANILIVTALFSLLVPFTMARMHERYFLLADVCIMLYVVVLKRKYYLIALSQLASLICLLVYLNEDIALYLSNSSLGNMYVQNIDALVTTMINTIAATINIVMICVIARDIKRLNSPEVVESDQSII